MNDDDAKRLIALVSASLDFTKLILVEIKMLREDVTDMRSDLYNFRKESGRQHATDIRLHRRHSRPVRRPL